MATTELTAQTFERTVLDNDGIHLQVRAGGSADIYKAHVVVDDA